MLTEPTSRIVGTAYPTTDDDYDKPYGRSLQVPGTDHRPVRSKVSKATYALNSQICPCPLNQDKVISLLGINPLSPVGMSVALHPAEIVLFDLETSVLPLSEMKQGLLDRVAA